MSMVAGGARREKQVFDRAAAAASSTLLLLAAIALVVPAAFHFVAEGAEARGALSAARESAIEHRHVAAHRRRAVRGLPAQPALLAAHAPPPVRGPRAREHAAPAPVGRAVVTLLVATALVAWMSELLVGAVEGASHALGFTEIFVGVIVVAVVGNAAEHSTAVPVAIKDQMDLSLNIAIGSSIQIALFVAPVLVFASRLMAGRAMDLHLHAVRGAGGDRRDGDREPGRRGRRIELARGRHAARGLPRARDRVLLPALSAPRG